ncbi:ATP-dependent helicase [Blattabacterium cuenoti]|uniref:ATP-dependent helicase n=1 Tax=Blattabacterium cuenoti TaxID=1653831 RepID=UPI00163D139A|nr:UvrD-helicase domain-containing protein [Blattabacterium cuenoti]
MDNIDKKLSDIQKKIIKTINGPILVLAGAGAGKTRVITHRITYMIRKIKIHPSNILALTFTNKAAKEMKYRISQMINESDLNQITIGTFHSIFSSILRKEIHWMGYQSNYVIYDQRDSENLIKKILKETNFDRKLRPKEIMNRMSEYKNNLYSRSLNKNSNCYDKIYYLYMKRCFQARALDFDDILLYTNCLFFYYPNVLHKYQIQFKYILIDEYQDTNSSQNNIIKKLSYIHRNIFAVGDDAQSIYSFRGANISNILNFHIDYKNAQVFRLEQNYRSTNHIVQASNNVISLNKHQILKKIWTNNEKGEKLEIHKFSSEVEESKFIASSIISIIEKDKKIQFKNFAILYRTNFQSQIIEFALKENKIPYKIYGSISFENRKEIRDLFSYFRIIVNEKDEESLVRILKKKIGYQKTINSILEASIKTNQTVYFILKNIKHYGLLRKKKTIENVVQFILKIEEIRSKSYVENAYKIAIEIVHFFIQDNDSYEYKDFQYIIEYIYSYVQEQKNLFQKNNIQLSDFLHHFYLEKYNENIIDQKKNNKQDYVSLMTIHLSKGLEFSTIFVAGLEEKLFPSRSTMNDPIKIEEERRLFYVALTRAKKKAILSYAENRTLWGKKKKMNKSRFIHELIHKSAINIIEEKPQLKKYMKLNSSINKSNNDQLINHVFNNLQIKKGVKVFHKKFGIGTIINIHCNEQIVSINFLKVGIKKILLSLNKLYIYEEKIKIS